MVYLLVFVFKIQVNIDNHFIFIYNLSILKLVADRSC